MKQEPQFASQVRVNAHPELKQEFIHRVLELPWAFVSDETSLQDFGADVTPLLEKVKEIYGLGVSEATDGNLADILERIASKASEQS